MREDAKADSSEEEWVWKKFVLKIELELGAPRQTLAASIVDIRAYLPRALATSRLPPTLLPNTTKHNNFLNAVYQITNGPHISTALMDNPVLVDQTILYLDQPDIISTSHAAKALYSFAPPLLIRM